MAYSLSCSYLRLRIRCTSSTLHSFSPLVVSLNTCSPCQAVQTTWIVWRARVMINPFNSKHHLWLQSLITFWAGSIGKPHCIFLGSHFISNLSLELAPNFPP